MKMFGIIVIFVEYFFCLFSFVAYCFELFQREGKERGEALDSSGMKYYNVLVVHNIFSFYRYRPLTYHVQAWYDEVRDFSYPYPQECNPYCPYRCSGPVCTHYTQVCIFIYQ